MSNFKEDWWRSAVWAVRNYPSRKKAYEQLHAPRSNDAVVTVVPAGRINRCTEALALSELPPMKQREYDAVSRAISETAAMPDGKLRVDLISQMYWQGNKLGISGVSYKLNISVATGKRWHNRFIRLVGHNLGYF